MNTRTHIIDAISHSNNRSELRLDPGRVYSASLRLGNLGVSGVNGKLYNALGGVYSLIKNIYLMNNSDILDQLYEAHNFLAFSTSVSNENANNFSLWSHLNGNNNSYSIGHDHDEGDFVKENKVVVLPVLKNSLTLNGLLNLKRCFNLLSQFPDDMLDTSVFPNIHIVIEWRDRNEWASCFQGDTTGALATMNVLQPQLFADEVLNPPKMPEKYSLQFLTVELDRVYANGGVNGTVVQTKQRCNNFTDKYIERLLLINMKPNTLSSNSVDDAVKCDGSTAFKNEVINVVADGHSVLDFPYCNSDARKMGLLTDCFGDVCVPLSSNKYVEDITNKDDLYRDQAKNLVGKMSFFGCFVRNKVSELLVNHERLCTALENSAFWLYVLGQVGKQLVVNGNSYSMGYI